MNDVLKSLSLAVFCRYNNPSEGSASIVNQRLAYTENGWSKLVVRLTAHPAVSCVSQILSAENACTRLFGLQWLAKVISKILNSFRFIFTISNENLREKFTTSASVMLFTWVPMLVYLFRAQPGEPRKCTWTVSLRVSSCLGKSHLVYLIN